MNAKITADLIMSAPGGPPCALWPRERVEQMLARLDCSSWVALAESARAANWPVSLADLRLTAYRVATREQRIAGVRRSIAVRIGHDMDRLGGQADDHTLGVWGELVRWCAGDDDVDLDGLRSAAASSAYAYAAASSSASSASSYAYAAAAASYAASSAYAAESWDGLLYICQLLDGESP